MAVKKKTAKKKVRKKKALVKKSSAKSMAVFEDNLAAKAAEGLAREAPSVGNKISFKTGEFSMGGDIIGDTMEVVIFTDLFVNEWYGGRAYDPDNPSSPVCFAIADEEKDLAPHDNSILPHDDTCEDCEFNVFGSAETGRGKECKNTRRLGVVSYDSVIAGADPADAEIGIISVPPTSIRRFTSYKKKIAKTNKRPLDAMAVELSLVKEDGAIHYVLNFDTIEPLTPEQYDYVQSLVEFNAEDIRAPYQPAEEDAPKRKTSKKKTSKRKAKRKF